VVTPGHQSTIVFQAAKTRLPDRGADVFDNDIHTLASGELPHTCHNILGVMVDHLVSPNLARFLELVVRAGRGHDYGAHGLGNLHSIAANATPGSHDQDVFTRAHTGTVDEHLIGREASCW
jgi:hypothetical protein